MIRNRIREAKAREKRRIVEKASCKLHQEARRLDSAFREIAAVPIPVSRPASPPVGKRDDEVYIYGICDPRDHVVRYVGKTRGPLLDRLHGHEFTPSNQALCEWLKALRTQGVRAEIRALEVCENFRWQDREIYWIAKIRKEHKLLNVAKGGRFYAAPKGNLEKCASQRFQRLTIARSGPVRHLSREEIEALRGSISPPPKVARFRSGLPTALAERVPPERTITTALVSRG
jgi:hypothetical protein